MDEGKEQVSFRMRGELRAQMMAFAEREKRSLGSLAALLVEWSFEQLKAAGGTSALLGRSTKRLSRLTRDQRRKHE
jgi:hypothetical protein